MARAASAQRISIISLARPRALRLALRAHRGDNGAASRRVSRASISGGVK